MLIGELLSAAVEPSVQQSVIQSLDHILLLGPDE